MMDEQSIQTATMVIIHAGNARAWIQKALKSAESSDLKTAESQLESADEEIRAAHRTQTEMIQAEARGETMPLSLLIVHAQDTLMTAMSEAHMARHLLALYRRLYELTGEAYRG